MKTLVVGILFLLFMISASDASAILAPRLSPNNKLVHFEKTHKLKLKEKVALWSLRRKLKKKLRKAKKHSQVYVDSTSCDQILLRTGDKLAVRIIKISENDVRFVRCTGDTDEIVLSKLDIFEIQLSDGVVIYKNKNKSKTKKKSNNQVGKVVLIVLGVVIGSILLGFLFLLALVSGL